MKWLHLQDIGGATVAADLPRFFGVQLGIGSIYNWYIWIGSDAMFEWCCSDDDVDDDDDEDDDEDDEEEEYDDDDDDEWWMMNDEWWMMNDERWLW